MTKLKLPEKMKSPMDYFLEKCNPEVTTGILITVSAYKRSLEDKRFEKKILNGGEEWYAGAFTDDKGKYWPPIRYFLRKIKAGWLVTELDYDGEHYEFSDSRYDVTIDA